MLTRELALEKLAQEHKIQTKIKADRDRIKQDLHDSLGGQLSSISFGLNRMSTTDSNEMLTTVQNLADKAMNELRDSLWVLDKDKVSIEELEQRINSLFWQYRKIEIPINLDLQVYGLERQNLSAIVAGNFFRIAQEAIQNSVKHSQAEKITVTLSISGKELSLLVSDNGKGFELDGSTSGEHFGLNNMAERARKMNARLEVFSKPGFGTSVKVEVNLGQEHEI